MTALDQREWTISTLSKALRKKEISPIEVTRAYLDRIETYDQKINSFISILPQQALKSARQAETDILKGKYLGPLHGILTLSLPCGFSAAGLPIGLQIVARSFDEETTLRVGHVYEMNTPWKNQHPSLD